jgi:hypothetical protein
VKAINKFFLILSLVLILFNSNLHSVLIKAYQKNNELFFSFYDNNSCKVFIPDLNFEKNYSVCFDLIYLDLFKTNLKKPYLKVEFDLNNKTLKEIIKLKKIQVFNYSIYPKKIKITDKTLIHITTNSEGSLKVLDTYYLLKKGENTIDLTNLLIKNKFYGKLDLTIDLCKNKYCKKFKDYIIVDKSPFNCTIRIIKNFFPNYLTFNFQVFDQKNEIYSPKIVFFDMNLIPIKEENYYKVIFPKFYPAGKFPIKIKIDGRTCKKVINLDYSNYFYALSTPIEKKLNMTKVFIQNPYKKEVNLKLFAKVSNKTYFLTLKPFEIKVLTEKFGPFEIFYKDKKVYSFEPKVVADLYSDVSGYLKLIIFTVLFFIISVNIFVFLFGSK